MTERDPLALDSGLPEGVAKWTNPRFEFDIEVRDGEVLILKIDLEFADIDTEDTTKYFACGPGWTTNDKGKTAEREDGGNKSFNKNTAIGKLVKAMVEAGADVEMRKRVEGGTTLRHAAMYDNWTFDMVIQTNSFSNRETGEKVEYDSLIPGTLVKGGSSGAKAAGSTAKSGAVAKPAGTSKAASAAPAVKSAGSSKGKAKVTEVAEEIEVADGPADAAPYTISDEVRAELKGIADRVDTPEEFQEIAYTEIEGATEDADIMAAIEDLDDESEWSVWAEAVREASQ